MTSQEHHQKIATDWAARQLTALGCELHAAERGAWDILTPHGWRTAENWRELCAVTHEIAKASARAALARAGAHP